MTTTEMSKRKTGFYWVKVGKYSPWSVAEYLESYWIIGGSTAHLIDNYFLEIDERPIVREEPKHPNYTGFSGTVDRIPQNE